MQFQHITFIPLSLCSTISFSPYIMHKSQIIVIQSVHTALYYYYINTCIISFCTFFFRISTVFKSNPWFHNTKFIYKITNLNH